jgi:hypothetical protein
MCTGGLSKTMPGFLPAKREEAPQAAEAHRPMETQFSQVAAFFFPMVF